MGQQITTIVNRFDGGVTEDLREPSINRYAIARHFDHEFTRKLRPQFKTEQDETKALKIGAFCFGQHQDGERLFGLGVTQDANEYGAVFEYDAETNWTTGWTDPDTGASDAFNEAEEGVKNGNRTFVWYHDFVYFWTDNALCQYDAVAANAIPKYLNTSDAFDVFGSKDMSFTNASANPVHHPSDDILYFFYDDKVGLVNDTTPDADVGLGLPDDWHITAACAYGDYLAIAMVSQKYFSNGKSQYYLKNKVFLWDRDTSNVVLSEVIDFGEGRIVHMAELDGKLIAVVDEYATEDVGLGRGKVVIKEKFGKTSKVLNYLEVDTNTSQTGANVYTNSVLPGNSVIHNNKLYFACIPVKGSDNRMGIWSTDTNGRLDLFLVEEDASSSIENIFKMGNVWWIAHSGDGSIQRTDDAAAYSTTTTHGSLPSVYESLVNLGDSRLNSGKKKKMFRVGVFTEALPAAGIVNLWYKKDEETTWTQIFTNTTDNSTSYFAINQESNSNAPLPEFYDVQLRVESIGGAVITGIYMESEVIDKDK